MSNQTFSQKLKRLEEIVTTLEQPDLELEQGLKLLEEGVGLQKDCQALLAQSEIKISQLLSQSPSTEEAADSEVDALLPDNQEELPF